MSIQAMTWVWQHSQAKHGPLLVLLAIADCASDDGTRAWPSVAELIRKSRLTERGVRDAIHRLEQIGELAVERNAGPRGVNRYRVVMGTPAETAPAETAAPRQKLPQTPAESAGPPANFDYEPAENCRGNRKEPSLVRSTKALREERRTRVPDNFTVTPTMLAWAAAKSLSVDLTDETEKFLEYYRSAGSRWLDWRLVWQRWMREAQKREDRERLRSNGNARASPRPTTDDKIRNTIALGALVAERQRKELA